MQAPEVQETGLDRWFGSKVVGWSVVVPIDVEQQVVEVGEVGEGGGDSDGERVIAAEIEYCEI